jgi:hypothetical protein
VVQEAAAARRFSGADWRDRLSPRAGAAPILAGIDRRKVDRLRQADHVILRVAVMERPIDRIEPGPERPRQSFADDRLAIAVRRIKRPAAQQPAGARARDADQL